jgi:hypothetical protein
MKMTSDTQMKPTLVKNNIFDYNSLSFLMMTSMYIMKKG